MERQERARPRRILHVDLDAFFASVEELFDPSLRGKPLAVVGSPSGRGVISAASYAAREFGVRSAMPSAQALRLCPELILVPPRRGVYGRFSRQVMEILGEYSPLVEQVSIDEAFLDITGCEMRWGEARDVAAKIQGRILREVGLSASVGLGSSKLVAKIASDLKKPGGLVVVEPGQEAAFLAPLEVERLWGVGTATASRLRALGIRTVGDLAAFPLAKLERAFGPHALGLQRRAKGVDRSKVAPAREVKSISREITFARDVADPDLLRQVLLGLSEKVARSLRRQEAEARTITLKLRYSDFTTLTRSQTLPQPTVLGAVIHRVAWRLLLRAWDRDRPVRLVGVGVGNLKVEGRQLSFLAGPEQQQRELADVLDRLRDRYGEDVVRPATLLQDREDEETGNPPRS